jgi:hypothetical protein
MPLKDFTADLLISLLVKYQALFAQVRVRVPPERFQAASCPTLEQDLPWFGVLARLSTSNSNSSLGELAGLVQPGCTIEPLPFLTTFANSVALLPPDLLELRLVDSWQLP